MLPTSYDQILPQDTFEEWRLKLNDAINGLEDVAIVANEIEKISLLFSQDTSLSSGLDVHVRAGVIRNGSQSYDIPATLVSVANTNGIHIIYIDVLGAQILTAPLAGTPNINIIPLFRVTVLSGAITNIKDIRTWANVFVDTSLVLSAKQEEQIVATAGQTIFTTTLDDTYINNVSVYIDGLRIADGATLDYTVSSDAFNKIVVTLNAPATLGQEVLVVANQDDHSGNIKIVSETITAASNGQTTFVVTDPDLIPITSSFAVYVQGVRQHSFSILSANSFDIGYGVASGTEVLVVKNEASGSDNLTILEAGTNGQILFKKVVGLLNTVEWRDPLFDASAITSGILDDNRIPKATPLETYQGLRDDVFVTPSSLRGASLKSSIDHWHKRYFSSNSDFYIKSTQHPSHLQGFFGATSYGAVIANPEIVSSWGDINKHLPNCPLSAITGITTIPFDYSNSGNQIVVVSSEYGMAYIISSAGSFTNSNWVSYRPDQIGFAFDEKILDAQLMIHKKATDEPILFIVTQTSVGFYNCYRRTLASFIANSGGWASVLTGQTYPIILNAPVSRHNAGDTNDGLMLVACRDTVRIIRDTAEDGTLETITDTAIGAFSGSNYITTIMAVRNATAEDWDVLVGGTEGIIYRRNSVNLVTSVASAYTVVSYPVEISPTEIGKVNKFLPTNNGSIDQLFVLTDNIALSASNEIHSTYDTENNVIGGKLVHGMDFHAMTCGANTYSATNIANASKVVIQNEMGDISVGFPTASVGANTAAIRFMQNAIRAYTTKYSPAPVIEVVGVDSAGGLTAIGAKSPVNTVWAMLGNTQGGYPIPVSKDLLAVFAFKSIYETNGDDRYILAVAIDGVYVYCPSDSVNVRRFIKTARTTVNQTGFIPKCLKENDTNYYVPVVNKADTFVVYGAIAYGTPASVMTIGGYQLELSSIVGTFSVGNTLTWGGGSGTVKGIITNTRIVVDNVTNLSIGEGISNGLGATANVATDGIIRFEPIDGHKYQGINFYISPELGSSTTKVCYSDIANIATNKGAVQYLPVGGVGELPVPSGFNYTSIGTIAGIGGDTILVGTDNGKIYACEGDAISTPAWTLLSNTIDGVSVTTMGGIVQEIVTTGNNNVAIAKISNGRYYATPNGVDWFSVSIPTRTGNTISRISADDTSSLFFGENVINSIDNNPPSYYKITV